MSGKRTLHDRLKDTDDMTAKMEKVQNVTWANHTLCFRDDCVYFSKSNISNLHPKCRRCKEHYLFIEEMISNYLEKKSIVNLKEMIDRILWKYKKYCNYINSKYETNFQFKSNISTEELRLTEPEKHVHDINEE